MIGFVYAVFAGFCAATASTCAKLAMSPELQRNFWCDLLLQRVAESPSLSSVCETVSYLELPCFDVFDSYSFEIESMIQII